MSESFDVVVVGSGPGGSVTAFECAARGLSVLVLEEGPRVEPGSVEPYSVDQMQRQYRNEGMTVALGRPAVAYTEGRCVGGGSEVNSGLYHRPPSEMLERWERQFGLEGLSSGQLDPVHRAIESRLSVSRMPAGSVTGASATLERGAAALGWSGLDVPRWATYARDEDGGVVVERQSMSRTYLADAEAAGAVIRPDSRVVDLVIDHGRCRGVRVETRRSSGGGATSVVTAGHVVVAAGATQTPALLQRSGVRGRGLVGGNLGVHPTVKVVAALPEPVNDTRDVATYQVKEFAPWLSFGGSASTRSLLALQLADHWSEFGAAMGDWRHLVSYYAAVVPEGRGRVTAVPRLADPLVTYRLTRTDLASLRAGLARLLHLVLAAGATAVFPSLRDAPVVRGPADVGDAVTALTRGRLNPMSVHLVGTARMGSDPRTSVTDGFGRVHGLSGLSVHDASILPEPPGVNPQGTIMALAHRNTKELLR